LDKTRRNFLKKAGYAAPAVLTMTTMPAMASFGSAETGGSIEPEIAQPTRWQSISDRNRLRRLEEQGIAVQRYSHWGDNTDWNSINWETFKYRKNLTDWNSINWSTFKRVKR